ncbi:hypothetical protein ATOP_04620 [Granulimonas faecalis]|uniref:Uncharacterized protein n=1 Tax=Granulimonas faecalis TaxID=2894155 RepID=A0AAV5B0G9_9ACTN|nr:hypothetical protein ATOP_04620 [Granulimonas faecalis]
MCAVYGVDTFDGPGSNGGGALGTQPTVFVTSIWGPTAIGLGDRLPNAAPPDQCIVGVDYAARSSEEFLHL